MDLNDARSNDTIKAQIKNPRTIHHNKSTRDNTQKALDTTNTQQKIQTVLKLEVTALT